MDRESDGGPILTRRTLTACVLAWAIISCITGFQLARDGAGPARIAFAVFLIGAFMSAAGLLAYFTANSARRYRNTPREPIVMVLAWALFWAFVSSIYAFGMILNDASARRILFALSLIGAFWWIGGALAYPIAIRLRRRPDDRR